MAERYQIYASQLGVKFPSRATQEAAPSGSTDQGNVTYEVPGIHAVYKIETPPGVGNHTPGFEEVKMPIKSLINVAGCEISGSA